MEHPFAEFQKTHKHPSKSGLIGHKDSKHFLNVILSSAPNAILDTLAGKLEDIFFFADTSWTSYIVDIAIILCIIFGFMALFSKKKVIEISFLSKRFCVDEKLFSRNDMDKLDRVLLKLRQG